MTCTWDVLGSYARMVAGNLPGVQPGICNQAGTYILAELATGGKNPRVYWEIWRVKLRFRASRGDGSRGLRMSIVTE